jgi:DNA-directed RNA polymerase III subunit RPC2
MEEHAEQWRLIPAYLKTRGMAKPHITSFNYLVETELQQIVDSDNLVRSEVFPEFYLKYHSIWVGEPEEPGERWNPRAITPMECRLRDLTYAAPVRVKVEYFKMGGRTGGKGHIVQNVFTIGYLPIMLRSNSCVLSKCKTDEDFAKVSECPKDPGGYFIVNGNEKVLLIQEQLVNNRILVEIDKKDCVRASVTR